MATASTPLTPAAAQSRALLREAVLQQLGWPAALDGRLVVALNGLPHARWADAVCELVDTLGTNGLPWIAATLVAWWYRAPGARRALIMVVPTVLGAAGAAQLAKLAVAPHRPFLHEVDMALLGVKPRGRSFPSGHTATWVAGAVGLGAVWPRLAPAFDDAAGLVSVSRVYLGAHTPSEVVAGGLLGGGLAAAIVRSLGTILPATRY